MTQKMPEGARPPEAIKAWKMESEEGRLAMYLWDMPKEHSAMYLVTIALRDGDNEVSVIVKLDQAVDIANGLHQLVDFAEERG